MDKETNPNEHKITVKHNKELHFIPVSSITHITCTGYISTVHLIENLQKITIAKTLKEFEKELEGKGFIRINHNALANVRSIATYSNEKRCISFTNKEKCNVSLRKIKNLKTFFRK